MERLQVLITGEGQSIRFDCPSMSERLLTQLGETAEKSKRLLTHPMAPFNSLHVGKAAVMALPNSLHVLTHPKAIFKVVQVGKAPHPAGYGCLGKASCAP